MSLDKSLSRIFRVEIDNLKKENALLGVKYETLQATLNQTMAHVYDLEEKIRSHVNRPAVRIE